MPVDGSSSLFKLIDLDASIQLRNRAETTDRFSGTLPFASPEAMSERSHSPLANDWYAVGQTFAELGCTMAQQHWETLQGSTDVAELAQLMLSVNLIRNHAQCVRIGPADFAQVFQPKEVLDPVRFLKFVIPQTAKELEAAGALGQRHRARGHNPKGISPEIRTCLVGGSMIERRAYVGSSQY